MQNYLLKKQYFSLFYELEMPAKGAMSLTDVENTRPKLTSNQMFRMSGSHRHSALSDGKTGRTRRPSYRYP